MQMDEMQVNNYGRVLQQRELFAGEIPSEVTRCSHELYKMTTLKEMAKQTLNPNRKSANSDTHLVHAHVLQVVACNLRFLIACNVLPFHLLCTYPPFVLLDVRGNIFHDVGATLSKDSAQSGVEINPKESRDEVPKRIPNKVPFEKEF